jgi:soluble lytic murein transglycosylase-like protein
MAERTEQSVLVAVLVVSGVLFLARPLRADEIVAVTDESGRTVYVNTAESAVRRAPAVEPTRRATAPAKAEVVSSAKRVPAAPKTSELPHPTPDISQMVEETANRLQVDPQLVHAIIQVESDYDPLAVSRKGAMGLMQLIPQTAQRFGVGNPFDPQENIEGGVSYLRHLLDLYGGDLSLSLAAYNAGEGAVQRYGGIPFFSETQDYVRRVTGIYQSQPPLSGAKDTGSQPQAPPIFRYVDERGVVHYSNVE